MKGFSEDFPECFEYFVLILSSVKSEFRISLEISSAISSTRFIRTALSEKDKDILDVSGIFFSMTSLFPVKDEALLVEINS